MGNFRYKLTKQEVIDCHEDYDEYSVYESLYKADENLILQGEIHISRDFKIMATLDDRCNMSNRKAMENPKHRLFDVDLVYDKEPYINGLSEVIDFIFHNNLLNIVVEFSLFGIPVGNKRENLIIWELRSHY